MTAHDFLWYDVFTDRRFAGNPLAVFPDATGIAEEDMPRIARELNLSETTFVLPPTASGADYRVRIFTPSQELPFAGHPTLGTLRALLDAGMVADGTRWVQECAAGLIDLTGDGGVLSFSAPEARVTASPLEEDALSAVLGGVRPAEPLLVDVGPRWLTGRLEPAILAGLRPDPLAFADHVDVARTDGVNLYAVDGDEVHVRSFFHGPGGALTEDPVCGSGNAAVGAHLLSSGRADDVPRTYSARQGVALGRDGRITVTLGDRIRVGGEAVSVVTGLVAI